MRVGNSFGIRYAQHIQNEGFIRFTVAHELGHYFLPGHPEKLFPNGDGIHEPKSGFISGDPLERQADSFASALLMPDNLFRKAVDGAGTGFSAIEKLAKQCKTSITSTAIRFAQFTDEAVAVIVSSGRHDCLQQAYDSAHNEEQGQQGHQQPEQDSAGRKPGRKLAGPLLAGVLPRFAVDGKRLATVRAGNLPAGIFRPCLALAMAVWTGEVRHGASG